MLQNFFYAAEMSRLMANHDAYTISIRGNRDRLEDTCELIHFIAVQSGAANTVADVIATAVGEACQNAIRYGTQPVFDLELQLNEENITAIVTNEGEAVDFDAIQTFNVNQDFLRYGEGGLGLPLMKKLMDEVHYERHGKKNTFTLVKRLTNRFKGKEQRYED